MSTTMFRLAMTSFGIPLAVGMTVAAVLVFVAPGASELLEYDRSRVAEGEHWRVVTCHLAHWNLDHCFWDVLTFAALGALCEYQDRRRFGVCLGLSAILISVVVWTFLPHIE